MNMTYIGMNLGGIKERDRLIEALRDTRDIIEDTYRQADWTYSQMRMLKFAEANIAASLEMVMGGDAIHRQTVNLPYDWHKAMRPYRRAYVDQCQSKRQGVDPNDEENEASQHQAWLIEQGHDYAVFGGVIL